jgi:DeoR/GlpR family transcriptional regulator of sugar metabolism
MLLEERHRQILELLDAMGSVVMNDLVERFNVSDMTIRRDLDSLEGQGLLRRVRGGAVGAQGRSYEPPFLVRNSKNQEEKQRIAQAAADLIENGDSIALDVGTTTLEIAHQLSEKRNLTIVTACLHVANVLAQHPDIRVIVTGGILRPTELSLVGHLAERAFREFFVDKLFLGVGGIDFDAGLTEFNLEDALVKRAAIQNAKETIVVADSSKFGRVAFTEIAPLSAMSRLITDGGLAEEIQVRLEADDYDVILV